MAKLNYAWSAVNKSHVICDYLEQSGISSLGEWTKSTLEAVAANAPDADDSESCHCANLDFACPQNG